MILKKPSLKRGRKKKGYRAEKKTWRDEKEEKKGESRKTKKNIGENRETKEGAEAQKKTESKICRYSFQLLFFVIFKLGTVGLYYPNTRLFFYSRYLVYV